MVSYKAFTKTFTFIALKKTLTRLQSVSRRNSKFLFPKSTIFLISQLMSVMKTNMRLLKN